MKGFIPIIILILISIGSAIGFWYYQKNQNEKKGCLEICRFSPYGSGVWSYRGDKASKNFQTQEQCIDYCLSNK